MGFSVYLFRKEVKIINTDLAFLEDPALVPEFTDEQFAYLKGRLIRNAFEVDSEEDGVISFSFKANRGISAYLNPAVLIFSSGYIQSGLKEIGIIATEFAGDEDFAKFDPQSGKWEERT